VWVVAVRAVVAQECGVCAVADVDVTIGELSRTLSRMDARMTTQFAEVNRRLDGLQFVSVEVYRAEIDALRREVSEQKEDVKATRRGVVFAFMYPTIIAIGTVLLAVQR
jgi:hypothetical protein